MKDKKYVGLEIEILYLQGEDVITASISESLDKGENDFFE